MSTTGPEAPVSNHAKHAAWCIFGVVASLIVVGGVSGALPRSVVQVAPMVVAVDFVLRRPGLGAWFAVPVLAVWVVVMAAIWAYLLGLSDIASGTYSHLEVILTVVIALFAALGIWKCLREGRSVLIRGRLAMVFGGLVLQAIFMAFSFAFFS